MQETYRVFKERNELENRAILSDSDLYIAVLYNLTFSFELLFSMAESRVCFDDLTVRAILPFLEPIYSAGRP